MGHPVEAGNQVLIPLFSAESAERKVHVKWSQDLATRNADYYLLLADNITTGTQVILFIAAEYYEDNARANSNHISKVAELIEGEGYKLNVDSRLQYGQRNAEGDLRFIVFHDHKRKPYQHRFVETAIASAAADKLNAIAKAFGFNGNTGKVQDIAKYYVGDLLHTF